MQTRFYTKIELLVLILAIGIVYLSHKALDVQIQISAENLHDAPLKGDVR